VFSLNRGGLGGGCVVRQLVRDRRRGRVSVPTSVLPSFEAGKKVLAI
jgi:hypothetical protein